MKGPDVTMHREHAYGDKLQLDWCGDTFKIKGPQNQELKYSVMVLTWSASCYVYAVFVPDQTTKSTIEGIKSVFTYFDCLPNQLVIDNAKQMVTIHKTGRDAIFNLSFDLFMRKCGVPVNANNPRRPNEKTQVEQAVNLVQSRCLTRMRGKFLLLDEANIMLTNFVEEYINKAHFRGNKDTPRLSVL
ncbi:MAG: DDE-type integrase/transposase/recombinase [Succinivibrio sp.]|nr:DDE-type integrase/transposase/recombinase [Succinivibrio sp.]